MLLLITLLALLLTLYHLLVYPAILLLLASRQRRVEHPELSDEQLPDIAVHVAARNEEHSIRAKLENLLGQDYPSAKLSIRVLANGCEDRTVAIANEYADRGVTVLEEAAIGKTDAQNRAMAVETAEIVVFTDANTHFPSDALRRLVTPFGHDPSVGVASGRHHYGNLETAPGRAEGFYWNTLETRMKRAEAALGGLVGANGSIYALRREVYRPLPADAISDFLEPMMIAMAGHKAVYVPDALSIEEAEESFELEYQRKVRIVRRSVYTLMNHPQLLDPSQSGRLAWMLISHKLLRWATPALLLLAATASTLRMAGGSSTSLERGIFVGSSLFGFAATLGRGLGHETPIPGLTHAYYVLLMFRAALQGIYEAFAKGQKTTWDHARSRD